MWNLTSLALQTIEGLARHQHGPRRLAHGTTTSTHDVGIGEHGPSLDKVIDVGGLNLRMPEGTDGVVTLIIGDVWTVGHDITSAWRDTRELLSDVRGALHRLFLT